MDKNPFSYTGEVSGGNFWDRESERAELRRDILNSQKVVIYSKRRMGKTSLVKDVLCALPEGKIICAYIDLFPTSSVDDFISRFAGGISKSVKGPIDKAIMEIKGMLKSFTPALTVDDDGKPVLTVDFGRKMKRENLLDEVLEAFPAYCRKKGKQGVVVLDEFQQIAVYDDKHKLEATLRSHFQTHKDVSYVFLGSKKHLLMEIFSTASRPFYHSAKMFPIGDIDKNILTNCVVQRFKKTNCKITPATAGLIVSMAGGSAYYTQRLAHAVWNDAISTNGLADEAMVDRIFKKICVENGDLYRSICELLTAHQLKALKVAAQLQEGDKIFSREFLANHNWQKDSLKQALDALVDKDVLSRDGGIYKIDDVFFREWLGRN